MQFIISFLTFIGKYTYFYSVLLRVLTVVVQRPASKIRFLTIFCCKLLATHKHAYRKVLLLLNQRISWAWYAYPIQDRVVLEPLTICKEAPLLGMTPRFSGFAHRSMSCFPFTQAEL
jgi:hypothetical protein